MQIFNVTSNTCQTMPNFKAIKSVKCDGLYKEFPGYGKNLVEAFRKNPTAMQFCKKYDVNLVFHACKDMMNSVRSTLLLSFENPAKSKFLGFLGSRKDKIELSGYGNAYDTRSSLKTSTNQLMDYMLDSTEGKPVSGVLNSHIKLKEEQIADTLFKKELGYQDKLDDCADYTYKYEDLDTAIKDLIESSK